MTLNHRSIENIFVNNRENMKKYSATDSMNVSGLRRNFKNFAHSYTDAQVKVREATSNDPWGPSSTLMAEIADMTYNVVAFSEIMSMIWKRTNDHGKNWRHVYKALLLLEYLIKAGSEKVAHQCKENIYAIQTLREFQYYEEGKDQGMNVREKAKMLVDLLKNEQRLKEERTKALAAKERFTRSNGFGSDPSLNTASPVSPGARRVSSEIEGVRPATEDEEELQLQLALAMSREEAEAEEAKRRSDDVRLQMAISQSQNDFQLEQRPQAKAPPQSNLVDLLDISFDAPVPVAQAPNWNNNVDPWKTNAEGWGNSSSESSPAHQNWNNNNNYSSWGHQTGVVPKESWLNDDPFKVDPWIASSANTQNNNEIFGSNHSSPYKPQTNQTTAATSGGLFDLDYLMKPAAPAPALSSTNPFADTMFQAPPQAQRVIDPWANLAGPTSAYPHQIPTSQPPPQYNLQYNNNMDESSRNGTGGQQSLYPNLNGNNNNNSNARKGLFVE